MFLSLIAQRPSTVFNRVYETFKFWKQACKVEKIVTVTNYETLATHKFNGRPPRKHLYLLNFVSNNLAKNNPLAIRLKDWAFEQRIRNYAYDYANRLAINVIVTHSGVTGIESSYGLIFLDPKIIPKKSWAYEIGVLVNAIMRSRTEKRKVIDPYYGIKLLKKYAKENNLHFRDAHEFAVKMGVPEQNTNVTRIG